jgi:hypothetical protein
MDNSKTPRHKLDGGTIPNGLEGFWICLLFKDPFLSRRAKPCHDSQLLHRRTLAAVRALAAGTAPAGFTFAPALHRPGARRLGSQRHPLFKFRNNAQFAARFAASISRVALIGLMEGLIE